MAVADTRRFFSDPTTRRTLWRWILPLVAVAIGGGALGVGFASAIHVPRVDSIREFRIGGETRLTDASGRTFHTFARQRRFPLRDDEIPRLLQEAVVAAEDSHFFSHGGVDAQGVVRAALKNLRAGRKREGAST